MTAGRVLVLGGTGEARDLAALLVADGVPVTSSLAGRVARPRLPAGEVRVGGFGGVDGLRAYLREHAVRAVVDATHPFAERIGANAARACAADGVPLLRLARPGWTERPGDRWHRVPDLPTAAALVRDLGARVFLTSGRQGLGAFSGDATTWFLVRTVDPPDPADLPPRHELLLDRGPYRREGEGALLDAHRIDVLVTKDSGGALTVAKLDAARERGLPVVVVDRPQRAAVEQVSDAATAAAWVLAR
ncbi:cobalt-precorrin-6A reductase [Paraconexibacter algicola]|uniref:cobalt-precorrin-6A reductase n=1 Tax=Paraconexibacter algicola TaxID=2133960 RepID=UPI0018EEA143|nr:cobalt-precorrin-6A reductase [Paraconexibacter algicola]